MHTEETIRVTLRWGCTAADCPLTEIHGRHRHVRPYQPISNHRDPQTKRAHRAVRRAIAAGDLVPAPCEVCGDPAAIAHHAWGYHPVDWLNVRWLCDSHHKEAHWIERLLGRS